MMLLTPLRSRAAGYLPLGLPSSGSCLSSHSVSASSMMVAREGWSGWRILYSSTRFLIDFFTRSPSCAVSSAIGWQKDSGIDRHDIARFSSVYSLTCMVAPATMPINTKPRRVSSVCLTAGIMPGAGELTPEKTTRLLKNLPESVT